MFAKIFDYIGLDACRTSMGQQQQVMMTKMAQLTEMMSQGAIGDQVTSLAMVGSVMVSQLCGLGQSGNLITTLLNQVNAALPDGHEILLSGSSSNNNNPPMILTSLRYSGQCLAANMNGGVCTATGMVTAVMLQQSSTSGSMPTTDYTGTNVVVGYSRLSVSASTCLASMLGSSSSSSGNNLIGILMYKISQPSQQRVFLSQVTSYVNAMNANTSYPASSELMVYSTLSLNSTSKSAVALTLATTPRFQCGSQCQADIAGYSAMASLGTVIDDNTYSGNEVLATAGALPSLNGYLVYEASPDDLNAFIYENLFVNGDLLNEALSGSQEILVAKLEHNEETGLDDIRYICIFFMNESLTANGSFPAITQAAAYGQFSVGMSYDYRGVYAVIAAAAIPDEGLGMVIFFSFRINFFCNCLERLN